MVAGIQGDGLPVRRCRRLVLAENEMGLRDRRRLPVIAGIGVGGDRALHVLRVFLAQLEILLRLQEHAFGGRVDSRIGVVRKSAKGFGVQIPRLSQRRRIAGRVVVVHERARVDPERLGIPLLELVEGCERLLGGAQIGRLAAPCERQRSHLLGPKSVWEALIQGLDRPHCRVVFAESDETRGDRASQPRQRLPGPPFASNASRLSASASGAWTCLTKVRAAASSAAAVASAAVSIGCPARLSSNRKASPPLGPSGRREPSTTWTSPAKEGSVAVPDRTTTHGKAPRLARSRRPSSAWRIRSASWSAEDHTNNPDRLRFSAIDRFSSLVAGRSTKIL